MSNNDMNLSPEFLEKAKACTNKEEFMELLAEEDVELSFDELEGVSGGSDSSECGNVWREIRASCADLPSWVRL